MGDERYEWLAALPAAPVPPEQFKNRHFGKRY